MRTKTEHYSPHQGWIKLYRSFLDWEWYNDTNTKILFLHLLLIANHESRKWQGILIQRGQRLTGLNALSKETGLGVQSIRTALGKLKSTGEITIKTTNKYRLITISNYDGYQQTNEQTNKRVTSNQQTTNKQLTTNKNAKNDNNEKKKIPSQWGIERLRNGDVTVELVKIFPRSLVEPEIENMLDYLDSKGKKYKNYLAFARKWVRGQQTRWQDKNLVKQQTEWQEKKKEEAQKYQVDMGNGIVKPLSEVVK